MKATVSFSKDSVNIFFHVLTRCNLNCSHCYINPDQHGKDTLSLETIRTWLAAFIHKRKPANLILLGGEPTLHPELSLVVQAAKALGYGSITVDTNGYLFHNILSKVTPDQVDYFSFSLDGATRLTNNRIRGKGSFDKCIEGVRKAVAKGFNTSLIYTVSRTNIHELEQMPPLAAELGIDRFFIQVIGIRGKTANSKKKDIQVARSQWLKIIPAVARKIARSGIAVTYPRVFLKPDDPFECAGRVAENFFIFPNGRVYRCPLCEDYPVHSLAFVDNKLTHTPKINEQDLFQLDIPEGCVVNKIIQPDNLSYKKDGSPKHKIACCLLKEEVRSA